MIGPSGTAGPQRDLLFDEVPCGIAVLDRTLRIVDQNSVFTSVFGEGVGRTCHEVCRGSTAPCHECPIGSCFTDGCERTVEETARDCHGNPIQYLAQLRPLADENGSVKLVAAIHTDLTATMQLQRDYQALFDQVPCYVAVLNPDLRVVKANEMFRRTFGEPRGDKCHRLIKHCGTRCDECPALETFADGRSHTRTHVGTARDGTPTHVVVSTAPLLRSDGTVSHVIEMCLDVTHSRQLEVELRRANVLRQALVTSALDAIVVLDRSERVVMINTAAEKLWQLEPGAVVGKKLGRKRLPVDLSPLLAGRRDRLLDPDAILHQRDDTAIPARLAAVALRDEQGGEDDVLGVAVFVSDLREVKRLEHEKLEAERLAVVGQTVAGLSHGIKNIMTGLEGGRYIMRMGLHENDTERVQQGWGMVERNINRIGTLARSLLTFSRGEKPKTRLIDPVAPARDCVELYRETARQQGIDLVFEAATDLDPAPLDHDGIHDALANLVSNAVDACLVSNETGLTVTVSVSENDGDLIYRVTDTGCGMDYEIKQKVFTSFFTTKGKGGTGLGLLTTRRIVQQHGGEIVCTSTPGEGTSFRMVFPRDRLPMPNSEPETDGT